MRPSIHSKIREFRGYAHETAGVLSAFFSSPGAARACAVEIRKLTGALLEVCGTQLRLWR